MKIIEKLSDKITHEVDEAEQYIKCALEYKETYPQVADIFYRIANEKLCAPDNIANFLLIIDGDTFNLNSSSVIFC